LGDVLKKLVHSGAFLNIKEAKNSLKILREKKYIIDNSLSMVGVLEAKEDRREF